MTDQLVATDIVDRAETVMMGISRGPWKLKTVKHEKYKPEVVHTPNGCLWHPSLGQINNVNDGLFIAAARDLVPELVAEVKRLYTENRRLVEQLDAAAVGGSCGD